MSNNRYTNAGPVGAGTLVDNMGSRIKSWLMCDAGGTNHTSMNVSSIVDNAVGDVTQNFTNPMATVYYPRTGTVSPSGTNGWHQVYNTASEAWATSKTRWAAVTAPIATFDPTAHHLLVHGNLA